MSRLDHLIPDSIVSMVEQDKFKIDLVLNGIAAGGRKPSVCLIVNDQQVWQSTVDQETVVRYEQTTSEPEIAFKIKYYNKQTGDTIVDRDGNIIENQCIKIKKILLNDVDIVQNQALYQLGQYHMELSPEKRDYFIQHGFNVEPNHSLDMYENGEWRISVVMPVLSGLASRLSLYEKHEVWIESQQEVYAKIYHKFLNIRQLQNQIKEIKCNLNLEQ
jgi:hypothetical protein